MKTEESADQQNLTEKEKWDAIEVDSQEAKLDQEI